jgi:hypothetical protein
MNPDLKQLYDKIKILEDKMDNFYRSSDIDITVQNALEERLGVTNLASLTGIPLANGTITLTAIVPLAGTKVYYVANSSGGTVNRKLTFKSGILTSET